MAAMMNTAVSSASPSAPMVSVVVMLVFLVSLALALDVPDKHGVNRYQSTRSDNCHYDVDDDHVHAGMNSSK